MIISHKYKFIFIKTRKTAGTSIEVFLAKHCGQDDIITPIFPEVKNHVPRNYKGFGQHDRLIDVKNKMNYDQYKNYFKFCIDRNPWDKTVSMYYWKKYSSPWFTMNFNDWVLTDLKDIPSDWWMYSINNRIAVDTIIRYEHLKEGIKLICQKFNIPYSPLSKEKSNSRINRNYKAHYNSISKTTIGNIFYKEIENFGYTFE